MTKKTYPLEDEEQAEVVKHLETNGVLFSAPAQSTWTKSWSQKNKNNKVGVRKGLPDLQIFISSKLSVDGDNYLIFIEMKRAMKSLSKVEPEQQEWHDSINSIGIANVQAYICWGADEAIKTINHYLKKPQDTNIF